VVQPDVMTMLPHVLCHYLEVFIFFDQLLLGIRLITEVHDKLKIDAFMANTLDFIKQVDCYSTYAYFVFILQKMIVLPS